MTQHLLLIDDEANTVEVRGTASWRPATGDERAQLQRFFERPLPLWLDLSAVAFGIAALALIIHAIRSQT